MRATIKGQIGDMLQYEVTLPEMPPQPHDIVKSVLTVTIGDVVESFDNPSSPHMILVADDADVNLAYTYVDDKDNVSTASVLSFHATDTIPPAAPGELSVTLVGEVF